MATRSGRSSFGGRSAEAASPARAGPSTYTSCATRSRPGPTRRPPPSGRGQRGEPVGPEGGVPGPDLALDDQPEDLERVVVQPARDPLRGVGTEDQQGAGAAALGQGAADDQASGFVEPAQVVAVPRAVLV